MLALMLTLFIFCPAPQDFDPDPEGTAARWIVVYNANWPDNNSNGFGDSEEVARYFAMRRGVPGNQVMGVACSTGSNYYYPSGQDGWELFWDEMVEPLRTATSYFDEDYILGFVFCHGIPYRLSPPGAGTRALDTTLMWLWNIGDRDAPLFMNYGNRDVYRDQAPGFGTDPGRFDPAVHRQNDSRTYLVARLDGLDVEHSIELVDSALYGDAYISPLPGYYTGTAYCDTRYGLYDWSQLADYPYGHGTYANADKDMAYGRQWIEQAGFTLMWEPYGTEIGESGAEFENGQPALSAPDALWYQGWYNYVQYFDVWEWKVGSAACDLNSNSIANFRQASPGSFLGNALLRGLTCGAGCIAEPYLDGHPFPEVFIYYILNGYPFAETARVSDPRAKWTQVYIGDPLYQPMRLDKVPLVDTQAPPPCQMLEAAATATSGEWRFRTMLDTTGFLPDLGTLALHHGGTPDYGFTVSGEDDRARLFHTAYITGLGSDELIHYRADYTDPAGNVGPGEDMVAHTALESQPVVTRILASETTIPSGTTFDLEVVFGAQDGITSFTAYSVTVTAAHMGWSDLDITRMFRNPPAVLYDSADDTVIASRREDVLLLDPGTYVFEIEAASSAGTDSDSVTIVVN